MVNVEIGELPRKNPGTGSTGDLKKWNSPKLASIKPHLIFRATESPELSTDKNENDIVLI